MGADMPRKKVVEGKRYPLNMRTTKEMREKLERAATESGRSMVQEVEFRLERSFDREELSTEVSRRLNTFEGMIKEWLRHAGLEHAGAQRKEQLLARPRKD